MHRVNTILSQLSVNSTSSQQQQDETYIIKSPFPHVDIPDNMPLHQFVMQNWSQYGDDIALIDAVTENTFTYRELQYAITALAASLNKRGLKQGDVIAVYSNNHIFYPIVQLAVSMIGGILTTINPNYTLHELVYHLDNSQAKAIFCRDYLLPIVQQARLKCNHVKRVFLFDPLRPVGGNEYLWSMVMSAGSKPKLNKLLHNIQPKQDTVLLPYSSGTTGLPKGVELTHYNIISNICQRMSKSIREIERGYHILGVLPFYHIFGNTVSMNCTLYIGARLVVLPQFLPDIFCNAIQKYKITSIQVVPPIILYLAKNADTTRYDFSSLRVLHCSSAPLSKAQQQEVSKKFKHVTVKQSYGMTECSPGSHGQPREQVVVGSIGKVLSNMDALIVDIETGKSLPPGLDKRGELYIRGPNIMKGYWRNPQATANTVDKFGWLHTGDIASVDENGYFYIVDRLKELIKVKGLQVAPAELEGLLLSHPEIDDAAVIPVPNERTGELPRAYVVLKKGSTLTTQQIYNYISTQVAKHKNLDGGIVIVDNIPKNPSGKILRRILKEKAAKGQ